MIIFSINTVGPGCEVAILGPATKLTLAEEIQRGHEARAPVLAQSAMEKAGLTWKDVDRFCAVTGPGSFTGIRVGISFARGLSIATSKPLFGVSTLESLGAVEEESALGILPAKRRPPDQTWWTQQLHMGRGVAAPVELEARALTAMAAEVTAIVGEAPPATLKARLVKRSPSALSAARLCATMTAAEASAIPTYARAPDAHLPAQASRGATS